MKGMKDVIAALILALIVFSFRSSYAYYVYGYISYWDHQSNRDNDSRVPLVTNQTNQAAWKPIIWVVALSGCKDSDGASCGEDNDRVIGIVTASATGYYEIAGAQKGESIYLISFYENLIGRVLPPTGSIVVSSPVRTNIQGNVYINWSLTCWNRLDGLCPNQNYISTDPIGVSLGLSLYESYSNLLQIIGLSEKYAGPLAVNGYNNKIIGYYSSHMGNCSMGSGGMYLGPDSFCCGVGQNNHICSSEIGHILHRRWLNQGCSTGGLTGCSGCGGQPYGWGDTCLSKKCLTAEGWSGFFATVANWGWMAYRPWFKYPEYDENDPDDPGGVLEGNVWYQNSAKLPCVDMNSQPINKRGNVARAFCDLYDGIDDGFDDFNHLVSTIAGYWGQFPSRTGDGDACELDYDLDGCDDGRNWWDYLYKSDPSQFRDDFQDALYENCLDWI